MVHATPNDIIRLMTTDERGNAYLRAIETYGDLDATVTPWDMVEGYIGLGHTDNPACDVYLMDEEGRAYATLAQALHIDLVTQHSLWAGAWLATRIESPAGTAGLAVALAVRLVESRTTATGQRG